MSHLRSLLPKGMMERVEAILGAASNNGNHDAVVQYNAVHFFLVARGVACRPVVLDDAAAADGFTPAADVLVPDYGIGLRGVPVDAKVGSDVSLRVLVREVRRELRRWHEDGLKHRCEGDGEGEGEVGEGLAKDETARAVFRAFTELRDELLAEIRWRKDIGAGGGVAAAGETGREEWARPGSGQENRSDGGVDWTVLSEAML
ncbi:hypothetical protein BFW01_g5308 [Lasiodiplodia theobromae]|nr:hypothetical protein BFW01_g5308 [Lasiodiplodia theobromae]